MVNQKGQLIGINAAILEYRGIGFAIPGNMAKSVLSQLLSKGEVARGWLGIEARDLSAALSRRFGIQVDNGIIVLSIIPQGPAALAGIKVGDVISKIDGHLIQDSREALRRIADLEPMKKTTITIERAGKTLDTVAMVQIRPKMRSQIR